MKNFVIIIIATMYFLGMINVYADNSTDSETETMLIQLNIIDENYFSNSDTVTREECLVAIMRVIGASDEEIEKLNGADIISFVDTDSFSYFECAWLSGIAYGEECVVDYPTHRTSHTLKNTDFFFFPERAATVKETLAFMVRCLEADKIDIDVAFEKAKEYGLVKAEDSFIQELDSAINPNEFCTLLERFMQQKRYKYYDRVDNDFRPDGNIDEERSVSYLDMLKLR